MRALCRAAVACLLPGAASPGPPLLSDDPSAVPPGELQWISAVAASETGPDAELAGFAADLAYGLVPTLELDAILEVIATDHEKDDDGGFERSAVPFAFGVKWEPIRSEAFSLALAPRMLVDLDGGDLAGVLPLLLELRHERLRVGMDGTWRVREQAPDGGTVAVYTGLGVGSGSELLAELYLAGVRDDADPALGFNLGVDWALVERVHLLASAGTGLDGGSGPRREFSAYLGLQLFLYPGGRPRDGGGPASAASPGPPRLLDLTDRQLDRPRRSWGFSR